VPCANRCHRYCCGTVVIRHFSKQNGIVLAKAEVEADQSSTELLCQFPHGYAAVLGIFRHRCNRFSGVSSLNHVECHNVRLLCGSRFLASKHSYTKAEILAEILQEQHKNNNMRGDRRCHQIVYLKNTTHTTNEQSNFAGSLISLLLIYEGA